MTTAFDLILRYDVRAQILAKRALYKKANGKFPEKVQIGLFEYACLFVQSAKDDICEPIRGKPIKSLLNAKIFQMNIEVVLREEWLECLC